MTELGTSILVDIRISPFSIKRRTAPSAAFKELTERLSTGIREDDDMAKAFAGLQERFKGVALTQEDAVRLAAVEARGAGDLGITAGSWPPVLGAGLAFMYNAALETLRSTDLPIEPQLFGARAIRLTQGLLEEALPNLGSLGVSAFELALDDRVFADQLKQAASGLGVAYLDNWHGPCETCEIQTTDVDGHVSSICGTADECNDLLIVIVILLLLGLLKALWDWL